MRAETLWQQALQRSRQAQLSGALVPLATEVVEAGVAPFVLRRLLSPTPKHLRAAGPRPNPFLPWEPDLAVSPIGPQHLALLNKYPVQLGHLLLITTAWRPQSGWLDRHDLEAVCRVSSDTTGLWFFNSCAAAGASQPHRHLQLLPRHGSEPSCPLEALFLQRLADPQGQPLPWHCWLTPRRDPLDAAELASRLLEHYRHLDLGCPSQDPQPRHPYNLLFSDRWLLSVRRRQEHWAGFSINALGFAGYLLQAENSDLGWLEREGPWRLLQQVSLPPLP